MSTNRLFETNLKLQIFIQTKLQIEKKKEDNSYNAPSQLVIKAIFNNSQRAIRSALYK